MWFLLWGKLYYSILYVIVSLCIETRPTSRELVLEILEIFTSSFSIHKCTYKKYKKIISKLELSLCFCQKKKRRRIEPVFTNWRREGLLMAIYKCVHVYKAVNKSCDPIFRQISSTKFMSYDAGGVTSSWNSLFQLFLYPMENKGRTLDNILRELTT